MKSLLKITTGLGLLLTSVAAQAGRPGLDGPMVSWTGQAAPIPSLGTWGLVALALMFGVMGARLLQRHSGAVRVMSVVLITGVLLVGAKVAHTTIVLPEVTVDGSECLGGSSEFNAFNPTPLENTCSTPITISNYNFGFIKVPGCAEFQETCPVGTVVPGGEGCTLNHWDDSGCDE